MEYFPMNALEFTSLIDPYYEPPENDDEGLSKKS